MAERTEQATPAMTAANVRALYEALARVFVLRGWGQLEVSEVRRRAPDEDPGILVSEKGGGRSADKSA